LHSFTYAQQGYSHLVGFCFCVGFGELFVVGFCFL